MDIVKEINPFATAGALTMAQHAANINRSVAHCHQASIDAGWWVDELGDDIRSHRFWWPAKQALITSELSEALEGDRKGTPDKHLPHRSNRQVELADAYIRLMDLVGAMDEPDFGGAVTEKMAYNRVRKDHQPGERMADGGKKY